MIGSRLRHRPGVISPRDLETEVTNIWIKDEKEFFDLDGGGHQGA